ncbi:hypothetical protein ACJIZ3_000838 [Penstemon smallii]|uniref:BZIP domain-containing protein n=1 Tax=Penstemon smallii TaxID=265156 RepID=A0ABD3U360_9LAMI
MDSSTGTSSNSSGLQNSGSEGDLQQLMDQRKRKRMISNRESARRSRERKQKHLDDLMAQVAQLRKENQQILNGLNVTSQHYVSVEADNAILRAQAAELTHRLHSLNEIVSILSVGVEEEPIYEMGEFGGFVDNSWNCFSQPIGMSMTAPAASADVGFY